MSDFVFKDNSAAVRKALEAASSKVLEEIGLLGEGYAKKLCPVGTPESTGKAGYVGGTLRKSISHDTTDDAAYIGTNVEYAAYVEIGTIYTAAQPYLRPAVEDHVSEYKRMITSAMRGS